MKQIAFLMMISSLPLQAAEFSAKPVVADSNGVVRFPSSLSATGTWYGVHVGDGSLLTGITADATNFVVTNAFSTLSGNPNDNSSLSNALAAKMPIIGNQYVLKANDTSLAIGNMVTAGFLWKPALQHSHELAASK